MMKRLGFRIILAAVAICCMVVFMPAAAFADSGGYTTNEYNVDIQTDVNHVFHVQEDIQVNFYESRHGIYRYIPNGGSYYSIKNIRVYGYEYETYTENNSTVIKIGSGDYYVHGFQNYRISYDIVGYKDKDENADILGIDLLPTGWGTEIESAKATITFPKPIDDINVYSGYFQSTGDSGYFDISNTGTEFTATSKETIPAGMGLTIQADLPEGYWENPLDRSTGLPKAYGALGVLAALMLALWAAVGRDKPVIKPVEFYPPDGMDPLQVAYIANDKIESNDTAALFMYFANKGYLKVISEEKKKFSLEYLKNIDDSEKRHSKDIFSALFSLGHTVALKRLPDSLGEVVAGITKDVKSSFGQDMKAFTTSSKVGRAVGTLMCFLIPLLAGLSCVYMSFGGLGLGALVGILSVIIWFCSRSLIRKADSFSGKKKPVKMIINLILLLLSIFILAVVIFREFPILAAVFVVTMFVALISTMFVRQRANNDIYGRVMGFREFIKTAEYDRLKLLAEEDPEYYFNIMPYAFVFGMSNKWADKFANFNIPQPGWYVTRGGYDPYFTTYMLTSSSNGIGSSVGNYYQSIGADIAGDIASGGGGGGGFSGGGFGGGGGGSW